MLQETLQKPSTIVTENISMMAISVVAWWRMWKTSSGH